MQVKGKSKLSLKVCDCFCEQVLQKVAQNLVNAVDGHWATESDCRATLNSVSYVNSDAWLDNHTTALTAVWWLVWWVQPDNVEDQEPAGWTTSWRELACWGLVCFARFTPHETEGIGRHWPIDTANRRELSTTWDDILVKNCIRSVFYFYCC
jgi:hypothetical protein